MIGCSAVAFRADLSSTSCPEELFQQVHQILGRVDILVNNAGTVHRDAAESTSLESWQQVIQVNFTSAFQLAQLTGRNIISRQATGKIINVASLLSFQGGIRVPAYARPRAASPSSPRRSPTSGLQRASRSTPSRRATSIPPTPKLSRPTKPAAVRSSNAFPRGAGGSRKISLELPSSLRPLRLITLPARSLS